MLIYFIFLVLIYGSENRRKSDLERRHEKVANEARLEALGIKAKEDADESNSNSQPKRRAWQPSEQDLSSFGQVIRTMPNDPNTPFLAPDADEDSISEHNYSHNGRESTNSNSGNSSSRSSKTPPPKSRNIVPFEPPKPSTNEATHKQPLEIIKKETEAKGAEPKRRSSRGNIIFDPVPGLFPKIFVNRFFKQRKVQVIVHGPNNSKKEFQLNGNGDDAVGKLLQGTAIP